MAADPEVGDDFERSITPVADWAETRTGLPVVYDRAETSAGATVLLYPLDLQLPAAPMATGARTRVAEVSVRLLVSVIGASAFDAAAATSALALEAAVDSEWRVEPGSPDLALWRALGQPPVPAFILVVPVRRILDHAPAPPVRHRLKVIPARMRAVTGRVVAPTGEPLPAARVALADGNATSTTDSRGRFRLEIAAVAGAPLRLRVSARGASAAVEMDDPPVDSGGDLGDLTVPVPGTAPTTR